VCAVVGAGDVGLGGVFFKEPEELDFLLGGPWSYKIRLLVSAHF